MISTSTVCQYCLSVFYLQHSLFFLWHYYLLLHIDVCVYLYKVTWYDGVQFFIWVHLSSGLLLHVVRICRVESATARRYINLSFLLFNSLFANCHDNSCIYVFFVDLNMFYKHYWFGFAKNPSFLGLGGLDVRKQYPCYLTIEMLFPWRFQACLIIIILVLEDIARSIIV